MARDLTHDETDVDIKLKQRLVGALVLTMIAIILLPILLDGSPEERATFQVDIPESPSFEVERIDMSEFRANMAEMEKRSQARLPVEFPTKPDDEETQAASTPSVADTKSSKPTTSSQYQLDANLLPVSWTIQLGSFRSETNAIKLRQSLRAEDQISYILKTDDDKGQLFRVFVGPMLNKQKLVSLATKLEAKFNLKSQIIRYRSSEDINLLGG